MATIIEVQDTKLDNLSEYVEKMINYGGKVMRCIEAEIKNICEYEVLRNS